MIKDLQMLIEASENIELTNVNIWVFIDQVSCNAERIKFNFIKGNVELV